MEESPLATSKRRRSMSPGTPTSRQPAAALHIDTPPTSLVERLREQVQRRRTRLNDTRQATEDGGSAVRVSPARARLFEGADLSPETACGPNRALPRRTSPWTPPASPWGLLEEMLYADPWKLLVACILLNRTTGLQVRGVLGPLWRAYPTPQAMAVADEADLRVLLRPLGLHNTRAAKLKRFSHEFITKQWRSPTELHGVGTYAADAYSIFCLGNWRDVKPADKDLTRYVQWLKATGGEGSGLEREDLQQLLQTPQPEALAPWAADAADKPSASALPLL